MKKAMFLSLVLVFASCSTYMPIAATSNPIGAKRGTSSTTFVLGIELGGASTIEQAAKAGGITHVSTVDFKTVNYLIYVRQTCIVTGD